MGLTEQQRKETLELICSALAEGLGFASEAERWLGVLPSPLAGKAVPRNGVE